MITKNMIHTACMVIAAAGAALPAELLADGGMPSKEYYLDRPAWSVAAGPNDIEILFRSEPTPLRVVSASDAETHRIRIPAGVVADYCAGADQGSILTGSRSIVAAIALSGAVAFGLLAYRRGRGPCVAAFVMGCIAAHLVWNLPGGGVALADIRFDRRRDFREERLGRGISGNVVIEIINGEKTSPVQLVVGGMADE